jgi:hypothetical protein
VIDFVLWLIAGYYLLFVIEKVASSIRAQRRLPATAKGAPAEEATMDDHRTLDEFSRGQAKAGTDEDHDTETEHDSAEEDSEKEDRTDRSRGDEVEPPTTTYRWTPDGAACEECGAAVERRWRDGNAFVCGNCKEW